MVSFQDKNNKLSPKSTVPWHERLTQPKGPKPEDPTAKGPTVLNKAQGSTAADFIVAAWNARSLMISLVKEGGYTIYTEQLGLGQVNPLNLQVRICHREDYDDRCSGGINVGACSSVFQEAMLIISVCPEARGLLVAVLKWNGRPYMGQTFKTYHRKLSGLTQILGGNYW